MLGRFSLTSTANETKYAFFPDSFLGSEQGDSLTVQALCHLLGLKMPQQL